MLVEAVLANRQRKIRLPRELIGVREDFFRRFLSLSGNADTAAFTIDIFNELCSYEHGADAIMDFEQKVGRVIELDEGQQLLIDASLANEL